MRLRLLFTLGLVLCMATIASSNECLRYGHAAGCKANTEAADTRQPSTPTQSVKGEYSTLLVNKLLYI